MAERLGSAPAHHYLATGTIADTTAVRTDRKRYAKGLQALADVNVTVTDAGGSAEGPYPVAKGMYVGVEHSAITTDGPILLLWE